MEYSFHHSSHFLGLSAHAQQPTRGQETRGRLGPVQVLHVALRVVQSIKRCPRTPAMLGEELSTDMDRITQLQDAIINLLTITHTSIEHITKRTQFEQTSSSIPTTLSTPLAAKRADYREAIEVFVQDIVRRSKDIEVLIAALPTKDDSTHRVRRLEDLQGEMMVANREYEEALAQAEGLLHELQSALSAVLGDGHSGGPITGKDKVIQI